MEKKKCLTCGETITGRIDKKFCSDYCRNTYNNNQNKDLTNLIRNVNYILRKNRRILKEFNPNGKAKVLKAKLDFKGFNYQFYTNIYKTKNNNTYYFCYDQGYLFLDDDYIAIVEQYENVRNI